jgi:uncharacterized protein YidB (DUF937 family)
MEIEVLTTSAIQAQTQAEISQSVATAKRYPRQEAAAIEKVLEVATMSESVAESCHYSIPRAGKQIEGPSVRFAELLAHYWGNCRYLARVLETEGESVVCQGLFIDSESNTQCGKEVRRRAVDKTGRRYSVDMIDNTAGAGCSIAMRGAILSGIPEALWRPAYESIVETLRKGGGKAKLKQAIAWFQERGVDEKQICRHLGVEKVSDISDEQVLQLRGLATAIRDGHASLEEVFSGRRAETVDIEAPKKRERKHPRDTAIELIRAHSIPETVVNDVLSEMGVTNLMKASAEEAKKFIVWVESEYVA